MPYESLCGQRPARAFRRLLRRAGAAAVLGCCLGAAAVQAQPVDTAATTASTPPAATYDGWAGNPPVAAGTIADPANPERSLGVSALPLVTPNSPSRGLGVSELPYAGWQPEAAQPTDAVPFPRHGSRRPRPFDALANGLR